MAYFAQGHFYESCKHIFFCVSLPSPIYLKYFFHFDLGPWDVVQASIELSLAACASLPGAGITDIYYCFWLLPCVLNWCLHVNSESIWFFVSYFAPLNSFTWLLTRYLVLWEIKIKFSSFLTPTQPLSLWLSHLLSCLWHKLGVILDSAVSNWPPIVFLSLLLYCCSISGPCHFLPDCHSDLWEEMLF